MLLGYTLLTIAFVGFLWPRVSEGVLGHGLTWALSIVRQDSMAVYGRFSAYLAALSLHHPLLAFAKPHCQEAGSARGHVCLAAIRKACKHCCRLAPSLVTIARYPKSNPVIKARGYQPS